MIVVSLKGGLGNQLFQYVFGSSLSRDLDTDIYFDLSHYDSEHAKSIKHDNYSLHHFEIKEKYKKFSHENNISLPSTKYNEHTFNEITGFPSHRNLNEIKIPAYFDGYWQSEKYFIHHEEKLREDLQFKGPLKGKNKEVAQDIVDHNSVAIHIRRGDYLDHTSFGTCSLDYYKKAIQFIEKKVECPKFFIFSDDPEWIKNNIHIKHPHYHVNHNNVEQGHKDMRLMSLCQHFIIANSSFSWWGAWLSRNPEKIVTTPRPWFICRHPNLQNIDNGNHYHHIPNNLSEDFNASEIVLFNLNKSDYTNDIPISSETDLNFINGILNVKTSRNDSKLYLNEIKRLNDNNPVIMRINLQSKTDGVWRLYYPTKKARDYNEANKFYFYYFENDDLDIYVYLHQDVLLSNLMIMPSIQGKTEINIKSLEIREIDTFKLDSGTGLIGNLLKPIKKFVTLFKD